MPPGGRIEFTVGGEARIPVALASMTAKYLRELCMRAFNAFWGERAAGLEPTAGYPVDAHRWRRDAAAAIKETGLGIDAIWRRA
jgi:ribonuclease HII